MSGISTLANVHTKEFQFMKQDDRVHQVCLLKTLHFDAMTALRISRVHTGQKTHTKEHSEIHKPAACGSNIHFAFLDLQHRCKFFFGQSEFKRMHSFISLLHSFPTVGHRQVHKANKTSIFFSSKRNGVEEEVKLEKSFFF